MKFFNPIVNLFSSQKANSKSAMKPRTLPKSVLKEIQKKQAKKNTIQMPNAKESESLVDSVFVDNSNRVIGAKCDKGVYLECKDDGFINVMAENGFSLAPAGFACLSPFVSLEQVACSGTLDAPLYISFIQCNTTLQTIAPGVMSNIIAAAINECADAGTQHSNKVAIGFGIFVGVVILGALISACCRGCKDCDKSRFDSPSASPDILLRRPAVISTAAVNVQPEQVPNSSYMSINS